MNESIQDLFAKHEAEYGKFDDIPVIHRRHVFPDLCALLYIHEKSPRTHGVISGAEHDEIYIDVFDATEYEWTSADILYLVRCGMRYDDETYCFTKFV